MLTLALDTATPTVVVGVTRVGTGVEVLAQRRTAGPARHGETLTPSVALVLAEAGIAPSELSAVVVGVGPGPFTGLRVGMVTAAAFGDALGQPVYGVCSLDAVALGLTDHRGTTLVATDARRREIYWAVYDEGRRIDGPFVGPAEQARVRLSALAPVRTVGGGAVLYELPGAQDAGPTVAGLVAAALSQLRDGGPPEPLRAAYLRRPDATELRPRIAAAPPTSAPR